MRGFRAALLIGPLLLGVAAAEPDDDLVAARRDFDALYLLRERDSFGVPRGDSPHALAARFLSHGPVTVRRVCEEAWERARRPGTRAHRERGRVRAVVNFAYDRATGLVLWGLPWSGWGPTPPEEESLPPFAEFVGERVPRPVPVASAAAILERVGSLRGEAPRGEDGEHRHQRLRVEAGMALGEACRGDAPGTRLLREACRSFPADVALIVAAGWAGDGESVAWLRGRVAALAAEADADTWPHRALIPAIRALERAAPDAIDALLPALEPGPLARIERWRDHGPSLRADLRALGGRQELRAPFVERLFRLPVGAVPGELLDRVALVLDEEARDGDAAARERAFRATRWVFDPWSGDSLGGWSSSNGNSHAERGAMLGNYPSPEAFLHRLAEDLRAGRIRLGEGPRGVLEDEPSSVMPEDMSARSDMPCPVPIYAEEDRKAPCPVHVSARWAPEGLRVTLRNTWHVAWAVHPAVLRYAGADRLTEIIGREGKPTLRIEELRLQPGWLCSWGPGWRVPARDLVTLKPGESWSWTVSVREEDRKVECLVLRDGVPNVTVEGDPGVPVLDRFGMVWVRPAKE